ncbi:MAG: TonB-dependent receptor [Bacteroidales bacterium]|nr:TonB-dependent receptor [Bacteroidales bacterium]
MIKRLIIAFLQVFFLFQVFAQYPLIKGYVKGLNNENKKEPLPYANIHWLNTDIGVVADGSGYFELEKTNDQFNKIVVSYVGYYSDTVTVNEYNEIIEIVLTPAGNLDEIVVSGKQDPHSISALNPLNIEVITSDGLQRLACCSLAESFETSATVDVGYTDAVTGAKQIKMLGLAGIYSQMLTENQPSIRLLASTYGLNYVPGPWLKSISISKGTSSVVHGYESITGQINIDLKKPEDKQKLYLDLFVNEHQRVELNANTAFKISDKLQTIVLAHGSGLKNKVDNNNDGFLDLPTSNLFMVSNRYYFNHNNKIKSRFGFEVMTEERTGGQVQFNPEINNGGADYYGITINSERYNIYENTGFLLDSENNGSLAVNANFVYHSMNSYFGLRKYDAKQNSLNLRIIYISNLGSKNHKITGGFSLVTDNLKEVVNDTTLSRNEVVAGLFSEYTYSGEKFTIIAGLRGDYHNTFDFIVVPRLHFKYRLNENGSIRASVGRGLRSAYVLPENIGLLASSRRFVFEEDFQLEKAWNYGGNIIQKFQLDETRQLTVNIDFYRTVFQNQIVVDVNRDPTSVFFYNLKGESFSNSFQTDFIVDVFKGFEVTLAYRYNNVKITMNDELTRKPLASPHKGLASLHYSTKYEKWNFTFTTQYNGASKLPDTKSNPIEYQLEDNSPDYFIIHTQVLLKFSKWEAYIGAENLTNYKQENPILAADDPFGDYFDSSMVWGPVIGRSINAGIRFIID